jgi:type II secretion system protein J
MKIEIRNPKSEATPRRDLRGGAEALGRSAAVSSSTSRSGDGFSGTLKKHDAPHHSEVLRLVSATQPRSGAFTLLEVLIAILILAMVMAVVHSVFHGALQLRNKTDQAFEDAIPLQHTLTLMKRDLANLTIPGGTLTGTLQTSPTTGSSTAALHSGQQAGPSFYTASAAISDVSVMSEMQKVTYYLMPATNGGNGLDLVRSVTRNLLPVIQEEFSDQRLMGGVQSLTFQFYNGSSWADTWDSTATSTTTGTTNTLPQGIRVQLTLAVESGKLAPTPIELVVPVNVQPSTNSTSTTSGGGA